jgi:hypothetical protein
MSCDVKMEQRPNYLMVTLSGTGTLPGIVNATQMVLQECANLKYRKMLVDYRSLDAQTSLFEDLYLTNYLSHSRFREIVRCVAVVHSSSRNESAASFEILCQNKELTIKAFEDTSAAAQWISRVNK